MGYAKKSLGQNFLHNTQIRDNIIESAGELRDENVLEIGPGLGFLTASLIKKKSILTAVELDRRSVEILKRDFEHRDNFTIINGDILQQDLDEIYKDKNYKVIANIPYNITSPIIRKLFARTLNKPEFAILMVQKEVAQRICNTKKRTMLSISVEIFGKAEIVCWVDRTDFNPVPKVDSAVIKITSHAEPLINPEDEQDFFTVLHGGFSRKRKKIGNYFGGYFGVLNEQLLGDIDPNRRAETFTIEEWVQITKNFQKNVK